MHSQNTWIHVSQMSLYHDSFSKAKGWNCYSYACAGENHSYGEPYHALPQDADKQRPYYGTGRVGPARWSREPNHGPFYAGISELLKCP